MVQLQEELAPHDLFGGAIKLSFPARLGDVSDVRPVPDHQEAFTDPSRDQNLIVEIVEYQDAPDEEAAQFFFTDLARANNAAAFELQASQSVSSSAVPLLPPGPYVSVVAGEQVIVKDHVSHNVQVIVANVRLQSLGTDLLVTLNTPNGGTNDEAAELFKRVLATLEIVDWNLFRA